MSDPQLDQAMSEVARKLGLGATGQYPHGAISPTDEGELKVALSVQGGKLVINFGKSLSWVALTREQALEFATLILTKCGFNVSTQESP